MKIHEIFGIEIHPDSGKPGKCGTINPQKWGSIKDKIICSCDEMSRSGALSWLCYYHGFQPENTARSVIGSTNAVSLLLGATKDTQGEEKEILEELIRILKD